jgi:hypothetical protein
MKSNGSAYVALVFVGLFGYFGYQWWFNPSRAVKQRLGQVAGALSVPEGEADVARLARLVRLRTYLADDLHLRAGTQEIASRDTAVAMAGAWKPPAGSGDVHFADVQVFIESETAAHAYLAIELTSLDQESGHSVVDTTDASVGLVKRDGEWVITAAESRQQPALRPGSGQAVR